MVIFLKYILYIYGMKFLFIYLFIFAYNILNFTSFNLFKVFTWLFFTIKQYLMD